MADSVKSGFLRTDVAGGSLGPLVISGPGAAAGAGLTTAQAPLASEAQSNVASSAASVTLLVANAARRSYSVFNDSTSVLHVSHAAVASASAFKVRIASGAYFESPTPAYGGIVTGIWAVADGSARVAEGI